MFSKVQFWIWFAFAFPVVLQGAFAYGDRFFLARQVMESRAQGLPFLYHGGMWSDLVFFAPLMAYLVAEHGGRWSATSVSMALIAGLFASYAMHACAYVPGGMKLPEAHTYGGALTTAGWVHLFYMAAGIGALVLYYLGTPNLSSVEVWTVSGLLFVHLVIGTHIPFKMWAAVARPSWYPAVPVVDMSTWLTVGGAAVALILLPAWATR